LGAVSADLGGDIPTLAGRAFSQLTGDDWSYVEHESRSDAGHAAADQRRHRFGGQCDCRHRNFQALDDQCLQPDPPWQRPLLSGLDIGNDYFNLMSVAAASSSAPAPGGVLEPAAFSLICFAMLGAAASRRWKGSAG
jgi:hypothetical protein